MIIIVTYYADAKMYNYVKLYQWIIHLGAGVMEHAVDKLESIYRVFLSICIQYVYAATNESMV